MKLIYLDTETTELENPAIIQFACMALKINSDEDMKNYMAWVFKQDNDFIKTKNEISLGALSTHHITKEYLENNWKNIDDLRQGYEELMKDSVCVAHNAPFDKRVLDFNSIKNTNFWLDTKKIAYYLLPESEKYNLQYLRYYAKLEFEHEINPHDAYSDVLVLRALFEHLALLQANKAIKWENPIYTSFWDIPYNSFKDIVKQFYSWSSKPLLLKKINFWIFKGMEFCEVNNLSASEYRAINTKGRAGQAGVDYLKYLYWEETKKDFQERNEDLVYTLEFYINKNC